MRHPARPASADGEGAPLRAGHRKARRGLSEADQAIWASFTREIVPLRSRAPDPVPNAPRPEVLSNLLPGPAVDAAPGASSSPTMQRYPRDAHPRFEPSLEIGVRKPGLDDTGWKALTGGRSPPSRRLDLHGRTAQAAFVALHDFLLRAHADRLRQVEIITGRGNGETGGILRRELPHWLNRPDLRRLILAATHPHPGNVGSVRVLLRRR